MRWPVLALAACLAVPAVARAAAPEFPYTAYVASDGVTVRSGPGSQFYPCDRLSAGAPVEVYRHDPGGWCAIRPPEGSFSWVAGRYLRLTEPGLAVVQQSRVPARVGTRFSSVRDTIQVRLDAGEAVELLGESEGDGKEARPEWFKISPPAGEFRWIHADFLTRSAPEKAPPSLANGQDSENNLAWGSGVGRSARDVSLASSEQPAVGATTAEGSANPAPAQPEPLPPTDATAQPATEDTHAGEPVPLDAPAAIPEAEPGAAALDDVELDLSIMVAGDAGRWRLAPLRREVERIIEDSPSPAVRGRGRALLSKLGRFENIQARHFALLGISPEAAAAPAPGPAAGKPTPFDGQGRLTPVVSRKAGSPQFALLNSAGEVACFVTAAPGANLRPYLGKQVGITGIRGYMPELKARHVTARRVTVLETPVWR
ncbi:MAG: SH3 domain-containing protein [Pirellulales bacterium]